MFSFIFPCYNNNDFLRATLTSILWQTGDYEVIIVDNNSSKEDPNLVYHEFVDKMNLYLVKQPRLPHSFSPSKARNIALKIARGEWIISIDADIVLNPYYLSNLDNLVKSLKKPAIVVSERIFIDSSRVDEIIENDPKWPERQKRVISASNYFQEIDRRLPKMKQIETEPHPWAFMHGSNMIYSRKSALEIEGYDESYDGNWGYEDVDFGYRMISQANVKPYYDPGLYCYHLEQMFAEDEKSKRFEKKNNPNWIKICQKIPGFKDYKEGVYQCISKQINL